MRPLRAASSGLDLRALEIFVAVCEHHGMTAAASHLGTSQPAVTQAVRQLERNLEVELFDRQTRPARLTVPGQVLLERARGLLADADGARIAVRVAAERSLPALRLGLVDSVAGTVGPSLIKAVQRDTEEVRVWSGLSRQLGDGLLGRELDLLVTADPLDDVASVYVERVFSEPFVVALPARAPISGGLDLARLARDRPLVRYSLRSITGVQVERYLKRMRVQAPRRMEFDGSESVLAMVQEGLGWAITTPLCLLQARAEFARITLAPLPDPVPTRGLFLVARAGESLPLARVASALRRLLGGLRRAEFARVAPFAVGDVRVLDGAEAVR